MQRRGLLLGLGAFMAAPALARTGSLMPVRPWRPRLLHPAGPPIGAVVLFANSLSLPPGFIVPDGRFISRADYPELWAAVGARLPYHRPREVDPPAGVIAMRPAVYAGRA